MLQYSYNYFTYYKLDVMLSLICNKLSLADTKIFVLKLDCFNFISCNLVLPHFTLDFTLLNNTAIDTKYSRVCDCSIKNYYTEH